MRSIHDVVRVPVALASPDFLADLNRSMAANGVTKAVGSHNTPVIFDWLMELIQLQGISDASAFAFSAQHGLPRFSVVATGLQASPCHRLRSYWHFANCSYTRTSVTCSEPALVGHCCVAQLPARNGRLAQAAVSLFLFIRDICDGNLVNWLDARLRAAEPAGHAAMRNAVLSPLSEVFGVGSKVMSMALADLLLAGDPSRKHWVSAGASMIAIDTLVHNFLHRTGALRSFGREHAYGPGCYQLGGCSDLIEQAAAAFDARTVNADFPANFPRFVQHSIWSFCTQGHWELCNGNRIDDRAACRQRFCPNGNVCARQPLRR